MTQIYPGPSGPNFVPLPYRQVSVQPYDGAMAETAIVDHLRGRDSYRRTRFVILHQQDTCAIAWVKRESDEPLFSPITDVAVLALPDTCRWVNDDAVDTANPSALAASALKHGAAETDTVVVRGLDGHVNFIHHPCPIQIRVVDVTPPAPAKLIRMAEQVLAFADLPAIQLVPESIDLRALARQAAPEAESYLIPCRASGLDFDVPTYFLDERPERHNWTMLACERSCQIHRHFYGETDAPRIDFCPRNRILPDGRPALIKCCLLEDRLEVNNGVAVVPWGAALKHVQAALQALTASESSRADETPAFELDC
jgi:hypothetical protein